MAILLFIFAIALQKSLCNDLRRHRKTKGQRYGIGRGKARYNHGIIITALTDIAVFWKNREQHRLPIERFLIFAIGVMKVSDVAKPE